jgi:hypothetical protein
MSVELLSDVRTGDGSCPSCDSGTVNVQGVAACIECDWTAE